MPSGVVLKSLTLHCSAGHAFRVFTEQMGRWWPSSHHIGGEPFRDIRIEPYAGGRWYEVDSHENTCPWGYVLQFEPPHLLRLAWHLSTEFTFDPDPQHASEVELRFTELAPDRTQFEFAHRHLERHGAGWDKLQDAVDSPNGWTSILECFQKLAQGGA